MIKNVAIYCRVSTDEQRKFGISVDDQRNSLTNYCKRNNYNIYDYYIDEGVSAGTISKRKEFVRLLKDLDNIDLIIFTKLDRFSRNVRDANNLIVTLDEHQVSFRAIDEDDVDTSTADGRFIFNLRVNLAEHERNKDSERINRVNKYKYEVAKTVCTGSKVFGYDIDDKKHIVVNEEEAKQVRALYNYYLGCNNINKTCRWFRQNILERSTSQIKNYLSDKKYIGIWTKVKTKEEIYNFCPAILDEDTFYRVQNLLKKNVKEYYSSGIRRDYIFSGLLMCGKCGFKLSGGTQGKKRNFLKQYRCKQHIREKKCDMTVCVYEEKLENYLKQIILECVKNFLVKSTTSKSNASKMRRTKKESVNIKAKMNKLVDIYMSDMIDRQKYTTEYKKLNMELIRALEEENEKERTDKMDNHKDFLEHDFISMYDKLTNAEKNVFWKNVIDYIIISDKDLDKMEVKFL